MKRRYPIGTILFLLFVSFTLLEIWLLFVLTRPTNIWITILTAIVSAMLGSWMAKREGLSVLNRARQELASGRFPGGPLADAVMILLGGALLITPGLVTDLIGFSTLLAPCRRIYSRLLVRWAKKNFTMAQIHPGSFTATFGSRGSQGPGVFDAQAGRYGSTTVDPEAPAGDEDVIEGDFRRVD